jgi:hypothetical protein
MGTWLVLAVLMVKSESRIDLHYFVLPVTFDMFCLFMYIFKGGYVSSNLFRPINICTFIMLVGIWAGGSLDESHLKKISGAFIGSSLVVAVYLYFNIFRGVDWAGSGAYLYGSKNSAGQIFLTAFMLLFLLFFREHKIVSTGLMIFFAALVVMMKSRASLLIFVLMLIYFALFVIKKPMYKALALTGIAVVALLIFTNENLYNLYIKQIMLNNKDINDWTMVTSYRDIQYEYFFDNIGRYWLFGTGGTYIEAMPMSVLMSYGVIGGIPVLLYSVYPLYIGLKNTKKKEYAVFCTLIISLAIMMWFDGLFEEQSPFGPGVKCYFLWLITGIFIGYKQEHECNEKRKAEQI